MANQEYLNNIQWGKIIAKAWAEPDFRDQLEQDPTSTIKAFAMAEFGVEVSRVMLVPPAPTDLFAESLSTIGGALMTGCGCATASAGGQSAAQMTGCGCATASAGGQSAAQMTGCGCATASAGGQSAAQMTGCGCATASAGGQSAAQMTGCGCATASASQ